jgi:hypothetical protein
MTSPVNAPLWVRWQAASLSMGWPAADARWWSVEVVSVAQAMNAGTGQLAACLGLGRQRAAAGLSLEESRIDLRVGTDLAGAGRQVATSMVDALTDGWVDQVFADVLGAQCLDPLTQLASVQYLLVRLGDLYGYESRRGGSAADTYALTVVRCVDSASFLDRDARLAALSRIIRAVLRPDEALARIGPNTAAAIVRRRAGLAAKLRRLRAEIGREYVAGRLPLAQVWFEDLPADLGALPKQLSRLRQ